jgi:hypothetical protein
MQLAGFRFASLARGIFHGVGLALWGAPFIPIVSVSGVLNGRGVFYPQANASFPSVVSLPSFSLTNMFNRLSFVFLALIVFFVSMVRADFPACSQRK